MHVCLDDRVRTAHNSVQEHMMTSSSDDDIIMHSCSTVCVYMCEHPSRVRADVSLAPKPSHPSVCHLQ